MGAMRVKVENEGTWFRPARDPGSAPCEEVEVGLGQSGRVLQRDVVTGLGDDGALDVGGDLCQLPGYLIPEIGPGRRWLGPGQLIGSA